MPTLPNTWTAAPLDADDLSRLVFTDDTDHEQNRALDDMPGDFGTMDTGLPYQIQWATNLATGDDAIGGGVCITNSAATTMLAGGNNVIPSFVTVDLSETGWHIFKPIATVYNLLDQTVSNTFSYTNVTANKAAWDGAVVHIAQQINKTKGPDGIHLEIDYFRTNGGTYTIGAGTPQARIRPIQLVRPDPSHQRIRRESGRI